MELTADYKYYSILSEIGFRKNDPMYSTYTRKYCGTKRREKLRIADSLGKKYYFKQSFYHKCNDCWYVYKEYDHLTMSASRGDKISFKKRIT